MAEGKKLIAVEKILDQLPISVVASFAIPFRRLIAERLFKKCGKKLNGG